MFKNVKTSLGALLTRQDRFLKYPMVQYIPLSVLRPVEGAWPNPFHNRTLFFVSQSKEDLAKKLAYFGVPGIEAGHADLNDHLAITAINFKAARGYFRFLTVKLIGQRKEGHYQIFYVTKKYFPKRSLHFTLYTEDGEKLAWENIEIL
jgi:hypothetical protein